MRFLRAHQVGRCAWLLVMLLTVLALFLLYTEFSLLGADFWVELGANGAVPAARFQPATAYCAEQDIMAIYGGRLVSGLASNELFFYEFSSGTYYDASEATDDLVQARWGAVMTSIEPHAERPSSCRFLLHGGVPDSQERSDRASDARVWAIEVERDGTVHVSEVDVSEGDEVLGRYKSRAVGVDNRMVLYGGSSGMHETAVVTNGLWCLTLDEFNTTADDAPKGSWTTLSSTVLSARFDYGSVAIGDEMWAIHGGYSRPGAAYMQSDLSIMNLTALVLEADGNATASEQPHRVVTVSQGSELTRAGHLVATAASGRILMYGGVRAVSQGSASAAKKDVDYVAATTIISDEESDDEDAYKVHCTSGRYSYSWCGFIAQYPGVSTNANGVQRGVSKLAIIMSDTRQIRIFQMDSALVMSRGGFVNAIEYENSNSLFAGLATLQYALVAACIFLLVSLFFLFRHRHAQAQFFVTENQKSTGVSQEVVDALPLIRYDADGKHVYVQRSVDRGGVEVLADLPEEEQTYLHPRRTVPAVAAEEKGRSAVHQLSVGSDKEALMDSEDGMSSRDSSSEGPSSDDQGGKSGEIAAASPATARVFDPASFYAPDDEGDLCAICLLPFEDEELLRELPCKHFYHEDCVDPWLLRRGNCPLCKCHVVTGHPVEHDEDGHVDESNPDASGDVSAAVRSTGGGDVEAQIIGGPSSASRQQLEISREEDRERQASRYFLGNPVLNALDWYRERQRRRAPRAGRAATVPHTNETSDNTSL